MTDIGEGSFALPDLEQLVGVTVVVANEFVRQNFAIRHRGEDGAQTQSAGEDRLEVGHTPFFQLGLYRLGRVVDQVVGETLEKNNVSVGEALKGRVARDSRVPSPIEVLKD